MTNLSKLALAATLFAGLTAFAQQPSAPQDPTLPTTDKPLGHHPGHRKTKATKEERTTIREQSKAEKATKKASQQKLKEMKQQDKADRQAQKAASQ